MKKQTTLLVTIIVLAALFIGSFLVVNWYLQGQKTTTPPKDSAATDSGTLLEFVGVKKIEVDKVFGSPQKASYLDFYIVIFEPLTGDSRLDSSQIQLIPTSFLAVNSSCITLNELCKEALKKKFIGESGAQIISERNLTVAGRPAYEFEANFTKDGEEQKQKVVNIDGEIRDLQVSFLAYNDIYDLYVDSVDESVNSLELSI